MTIVGNGKWLHGIRGIEEQVNQRERIFEISRLESLGSVCGGMAHDFNNLLTVIGIHADQIADADIKRNILRAQSEATELTSGLLAFSRRQEFREQKILLTEFLDSTKPLVEKIAKENIQFLWDIKCHDAVLVIDPAQLQQILINLVSNCDHAMPTGGQLVINAEKVDVLPDAALDSLDENINYLVLNVSDNGEGMSQEVKGRAFEPFFTTKPHGQGTGLGLAMVHGIVKNTGGMIAISSRPNDGTTVSLYLPFQTNINNTQDPPNPLSQRLNEALTANVLLIEDRELVGKAIQQSLEICGANVTLFGSAEDAWHLLSSGSAFDVIISDLVLPGMSGIELIEKAVKLNGDTKAILMSGHQQQQLEFANRHPDRVKFLPKPFRTQQLFDLIKSIHSINSES